MNTLALPEATDLSAKEQAQWLLHQLVPGRGVCNVGLAFGHRGTLRWWPLQQSLNHLAYRHRSLRTVVRASGSTVRKSIVAPAEIPLAPEQATDAELPDLLTRLVSVPFPLDREPAQPLVRAHLVVLPAGSVVCLVFHHLVADHTSATVLHRELARLYDGFAGAGEPPPDLAGEAPAHVEPPPAQPAVDYWVRHLAGADPAGQALTGARPVPGRPTFTGARLERPLSTAGRAAVAQLARQARLTPNMILLAAFYLLLTRHGAGPDLVVGIPVDARAAAAPDAVGFHVNTLPVRVAVEDSLSVPGLLARVRDALLSGMEYATASFEAVAPVLGRRSGDWRAPVFRHLFNFLPIPPEVPRLAGEPFDIVEVAPATSRLDLEWKVLDRPQGIEIAAVYSTEVHERALVDTLLARYDALLVQLAQGFEQPVGATTAATAADHAALAGLHATARRFPDRPLLAEVVSRAADQPAAPAVRAGDRTVSYADLLAAAGAVRATLHRHGLRPGEPVGLCAARGPELAAAVLGVWAAGGAYLPLDPAHPPQRRAAQLDDAGVRLVLADQPAADPPREWLPLATACQGEPDPPQSWPLPAADAPAYLIYTSGSTGQPKGVTVSHASLANLVRDFADRLAAGPADRTLWLTTFAFDISALELLLPLVTGGLVVAASGGDQMAPRRLLDLIAAGVTIVQATPTTWRHLAGELGGELRGRRVLCGGEPLTAPLAERLLASGCRLFNVYGPTETTIWSTVAEITAPVPDPVPIGTPIANTTVQVRDPAGRPVLPGVPGELCIAGAGVAIGYHGQAELTAASFRTDPVAGRYYRTGDQVRLDASGLVFLGRPDRQVKIRGHRIELSEVESVLESHPRVRAAAVLPELDAAGHLRLVAALQADGADGADGAEGGPALAEQVRARAAQRLPEAAVPSRYACLPALPVTGSGKVDYRALPDLLASTPAPAQLPDDPVLRKLTTLWRAVLGDDRLGPDAHFFVHGGHSLLAVELAGRIAAELGAPVGFDAVFDAPTPARLAATLATAAGAS